MHRLNPKSLSALDSILQDLGELSSEEALATLMCGLNIVSEYTFDLEQIDEGKVLTTVQNAETQIQIIKSSLKQPSPIQEDMAV
ncbi:hypothetical protein JCM19241_1311 [Vibrio ishigakensis]|uniref:Uncharacterized protein n=1 Tax=Vibrio ishigakensis TaxID=1481914 RepID=A0A0B8QIJ0_9VIBR|nr:hypothetical protein JCM19241_1311 [Vibrio ishigakensis]